LSLAKNTHLGERATLRFQVDAFDAFNNPHFNLPQRLVDSPGFGQIFSALPPRTLQLGAKILF
jgi:hypothetical protein